MTLIFCTDKSGGMMFFGKRQSRDSTLTERIISLSAGKKLWASKYSAKLFSNACNLYTNNDCAIKASNDDFCFVEDMPYDISRAEKIIIFNWNRDYPANTFFDTDLEKEGFVPIFEENFEGTSHETITETIYERK